MKGSTQPPSRFAAAGNRFLRFDRFDQIDEQ